MFPVQGRDRADAPASQLCSRATPIKLDQPREAVGLPFGAVRADAGWQCSTLGSCQGEPTRVSPAPWCTSHLPAEARGKATAAPNTPGMRPVSRPRPAAHRSGAQGDWYRPWPLSAQSPARCTSRAARVVLLPPNRTTRGKLRSTRHIAGTQSFPTPAVRGRPPGAGLQAVPRVRQPCL